MPIAQDDLADLLTVARSALKLAESIEAANRSPEAREVKRQARRLRMCVAELVESDLITRGAEIRRRYLDVGDREGATRAVEATTDAVLKARVAASEDLEPVTPSKAP